MRKIWLGVLLLLLPSAGMASGTPEDSKKDSKSAKKVIIMLAAMGLDSPEMLGLVETIDERTENGYLNIVEEKAIGGTFNLHYELSGGVSAKQLELRFTPGDSDFVYTARTNALMANYSYKF